MNKPVVDLTIPGVVHDLNNVFQTLLGVADVLSEDPAQEHLAGTMLRAVRHGQSLTDVLACRIDRKASLEDVLRHAMAVGAGAASRVKTVKAAKATKTVAGTVRGKLWKFDCHVEPGIELLHGAAWERVFVNLFSNARRAMPKGGTIHVDARKNEQGVEIVVRDEGEGIPAELLESLFEPHVSGNGSSGLGLWIVEALVRADGGSVVARNTAKGAEFLITIPTTVVVSKTRAARA